MNTTDTPTPENQPTPAAAHPHFGTVAPQSTGIQISQKGGDELCPKHTSASSSAAPVVQSDEAAAAPSADPLVIEGQKLDRGIVGAVEKLKAERDDARAKLAEAVRERDAKKEEIRKLDVLFIKMGEQIDAAKADADLAKQETRAIRHSVVETIGGVDYEGNPTSRINYLQRLRILVDKENQLTAARALADRLGADKERLDWLESFFSVDDVGDETYVPGWFVNYENLQEKLTWGPNVNGRMELLCTKDAKLRQAIDAALAAWKEASHVPH